MDCVSFLQYGHDSFVLIEDTAGAIDHQYRARLRDGGGLGSGNTIRDAIDSLVANLRAEASRIEQACIAKYGN